MNTALPDIDLAPEHWGIISEILRQQIPGFEVCAFGSRAKGRAETYSGLDLAIITSHPLALDATAALKEAFSESNLPWKVDAVDWATLSSSFRQVIEQDKVVMQRPTARPP